MRKPPFLSLFALTVLAAGQTAAPPARSTAPPARPSSAAFAAMETINPDRIRAHVRFLAHDLLEGRGTGQRGGDVAAEYIATQFALYGLKPAGDSGTYMQKVPMVGITPAPETTFELAPAKGHAVQLKRFDDYVATDNSQ